MTETKRAVGVDWASGYWLAVEYEDDQYVDVLVEDDFEDIWESYGSTVDRILVDVPIGLFDEDDATSDERGRECDSLARKVLGSRWSSVFTPPARQAAELAEDESHKKISEKNREIVGKGLSIQAYHIASGIVEIDSFLNPDDEAEKQRRRDEAEKQRRREVVKEAHPEVCFAAFDGDALEYSKTSAVGFGERLSALENVVDEPGEVFREIGRDLAEFDGDADVAAIDPDDVLDAMAMAVAAGADEDERWSLPEDPAVDERCLPMQMVYRAETPFKFDE